MARTTKSSAKKATAKKATAKKATAKRSAGGKTAAATRATKKAPAKTTAKRTSAAKTPAKAAPKGAAKKAAVKTPTKKMAAKKTAAKKAAATKKGAAQAPAKKAAAKSAAKKAAPKKPTKSPYDKKFLDAQEEALLEERRRLLKDVEALDAEASELALLREPGDVQFDEESGEGDTLAVERERDLALSAQFRAHIEDIDHALEKIRNNTYGLCEVSGLPIPKERLRAIPWARERVEYKVGGFRR